MDCFTGQSPGNERNKWAISIPVAPALQRRRPSPSRSSLTRGWEAAGLGGWGWGFGQELAPKRIIPLNTGKMGAVLVEEAGGKGLQGSMGQQGRPSVDEGRCHRVLEEAGCLSGFRVCEELDKTGGFFAPSTEGNYMWAFPHVVNDAAQQRIELHVVIKVADELLCRTSQANWSPSETLG